MFAGRRPRTALGCTTALKRGEIVERRGYTEGGRRDQHFFDGDRPERIAQEAIARTEICLAAVDAPAGEMPVVLGPGYSGILLHKAIGHGLEADFNRKEISIYSGADPYPYSTLQTPSLRFEPQMVAGV